MSQVKDGGLYFPSGVHQCSPSSTPHPHSLLSPGMSAVSELCPPPPGTVPFHWSDTSPPTESVTAGPASIPGDVFILLPGRVAEQQARCLMYNPISKRHTGPTSWGRLGLWAQRSKGKRTRARVCGAEMAWHLRRRCLFVRWLAWHQSDPATGTDVQVFYGAQIVTEELCRGAAR
ncbi:hypothetical protein DPEC_G00335020 [Dallia pectoralis]|uniref:Uncharacterized protein n=1 Tax=Dallia pectoralis TaxID=75939 RepID=A0ACC2F6V0_DALPE|nr:hypothetical protein DPEC_G00335020 [Dallia pectoralis]